MQKTGKCLKIVNSCTNKEKIKNITQYYLIKQTRVKIAPQVSYIEIIAEIN